jgi:hypothetical protein
MSVDEFWKTKTLAEMTPEEWEALCDGCGLCCLLKLEYEDSGEVETTSVSCFLLDAEVCRCRDYANRFSRTTECVQLTPENVAAINWLPETCAYKCIDAGLPLPSWHHLITGDRESVHNAGVSVKWFAVSEEFVHPDQLEDFVISTNEE